MSDIINNEANADQKPDEKPEAAEQAQPGPVAETEK